MGFVLLSWGGFRYYIKRGVCNRGLPGSWAFGLARIVPFDLSFLPGPTYKLIPNPLLLGLPGRCRFLTQLVLGGVFTY